MAAFRSATIVPKPMAAVANLTNFIAKEISHSRKIPDFSKKVGDLVLEIA
jgi:hypothetical protein